MAKRKVGSSPIVQDPEVNELGKHVDREVKRLNNALENPEQIRLIELHREPEKLRDGLIVMADGTDWNPGAGQGPYVYFAAAWHPLF